MPVSANTSVRDSITRPNVFCIGLGRTGTTSLTQALTLLGYRANHLPVDEVTQRELYRYFEGNPHNSEPLRLSALEDYDALADTPVCCVYQGLDKAYPGSKFVLTVREKQGWLASQERLHEQILIPFFTENLSSPDVQFLNFLVKTLVIRTVGEESASIFTDPFEGGAYYDRDVFSKLYDEYYAQVPSYFRGREDQLLILRIVDGEGWDKLAPFLGVAVPDAPFPFEMRLTRRESLADLKVSAESRQDDKKAAERRVLMVQQYLDAFGRHDLSSCLDCFADDAVVKYFDKRYEGRRDIEKWHRDRFAASIALVSKSGFESVDDTVTADLTITSKFMKRWPIKGSGRAVIRIDNDKIKEVGFESMKLLR